MQESMLVQVQRVRKLNEHVNEYELVSPDNHELPAFEAGAHIDVHIPGIGARQYSCVRPWCAAGPYVIAVQRAESGRGGSQWVHENLKAGSLVEIGGPRNKFPLQKDAAKTILIAGGIGITPLLCMAQELDEAGASYELVVCARNESRLVYSDNLRKFQARGNVTLVFSEGDLQTQFNFRKQFADLRGPVHVYCCGPASMMNDIRDAVARFEGITLHLESFGSPVREPVAGAAETFQVRCSQSNLLITVAPGETILDRLLGAGIEVDYSCKEGYCGTCITRYTEGSPIHLDTCLSETDRSRYVAVCMSRAKKDSQLILDL